MSDSTYGFSNEWSDAESHIEQAHYFYERGHWHEALRELQSAVELNPGNPSVLFNMGLTLDSMERYPDALDAYIEALTLSENDPEIMNCMAIDLTRLGRYNEALQLFERIEQFDPDYEPCYCNRIIAYSELGQHDKAEEMFYLARQIKEECSLCYYNIGNSLFSRKLYDRAIWCWKQTRRLDPIHPRVEMRIAQAYWAAKDYQAAKEHYLVELRAHPGDMETLLDMGILLLEMDQMESAREKFHRILELDPHHPQAMHYLGESYLNSGAIERAIELFHKALALHPNQPGVHYRLGECYVKQNKPERAREHLLAELSFSPEEHELLLDMGCLLEQVHETGQAIRCFEQVMDSHPNDPRSYHNMSLCYFRQGLLNEGISLSEQALSCDDNFVAAHLSLGWALMNMHEYDQSEQHLSKATSLVPGLSLTHRLRRSLRLKRWGYRLRRVLLPG